MKVYIDVLFFINYFYDFIILLSTSILLKRNVKLKRIIISSFIGEISFISLLVHIDKILLLIFNIFTSVLLIYFTFGKNNFRENIFYFYIFTIVIGGGEYLIGGDKIGINIIFLIILVPFILYLYIKYINELNIKLKMIHDVILIDNNNTIKLRGYLDTGNTLVDPLTKLPVIMISDDIKFMSNKYFYVPYHVINESSILKCVRIDNVLIDNKNIDCLLGLVNKDIFRDGVDVILNNNFMEMI